MGLTEIVYAGSRDRAVEAPAFRITDRNRLGPSEVRILASWSDVSVAFTALGVLSNHHR